MNLFRTKSKSKSRIILIITALIIGAVFSFFLRSGSKQPVSVTRNSVEMGTAVSFTAYLERGRSSEQKCREQLSELTSAVLKTIDDLDRYLLSWRSADSEVYRFNHLDEAGTMKVSTQLAEVIRESLEIARDSEGAMDITLRPVIDLWGIESYDGKTAYVPPSEADLEGAAASVGFEHLTLFDDSTGEPGLGKDIQGLSLDLGAVGKGYALDTAAGILSDSKAAGAILAA